jgi:hypothetical protein
MYKRRLLLLTLSLTTIFAKAQTDTTKGYTYNRAPLINDSYVQLPLGSIKAKGWLLKQLEMQRDGAAGHSEELYPESSNLGPQSDWLGGSGQSWERVPYYVKGLVSLAYTLGDATLEAKAAKWIGYTLDHQQANGFFGPTDTKDWWPRMPMMYAIQSYYEATADKRVIPFFTKYFQYQLATLGSQPLSDWGKARAGDNLEIIIWLYNITGDQSLLTLAQKLTSQAYPWPAIFTNNQFFYNGSDIQTRHGVNVGEALKFPALCAQFGNAQYYKDAVTNGITQLMNDHGLASGIVSGTESLAGKSTIENTETCAVVEWMQSLETAARTIHDASIGDRLERIAFNTLPAQCSRDEKEHLYYSGPNQIYCKSGFGGFDQDYNQGLLLSPYSGYPCCRYNMHMGWPYFVKNSWASTPDKGLAVIAYAPMTVSAYVAGNVPVQIEETTNYPFAETISMQVTIAKATLFPIKFRIPGWCANPQISVNGVAQSNVATGSIYTISRTWRSGDVIAINFPMTLKASPQINNSISIARGPLVYALNITSTSTAIKAYPVAGFSDLEIDPTSAWNYGLVLDTNNITKDISMTTGAMPDNPFDQSTTPIKLTLKAQKIPTWTVAANKMYANEVPISPVYSTEAVENVTLIPYGAENLRITNFPVMGKPAAPAKAFSENFSSGSLFNWISYNVGWYIQNGSIHSISNPGTKILASASNFSDLVYEADITLNSASNAGIVFRTTNQYFGADAYDGYYAGLDASTGNVLLGKAVNQKWTQIAVSQQSVKINTLYKLKVKAQGTQIMVYLNGQAQPVISITDAQYSHGAIGLRAYNCLSTIDDLMVTALPSADSLVHVTATSWGKNMLFDYTTSITNNNHIDIQNSLDSLNWNTMVSVPGNNTNTYHAQSANPANGLMYFRAVLYDKDNNPSVYPSGTYKPFNIIENATVSNFTAIANTAKKVDLSVQTTYQQFCHEIDIVKSTDTVNWTVLTTLPGAGTTNQLQTYTAVDNSPITGKNYYRLVYYKQGKTNYSPIKMVTVDAAASSVNLVIYPNPTPASVHFAFSGYSGKQIMVSISDTFGAAVQKETIQANSAHQYTLTKKLPKGIYIMNVVGDGVSKTSKVIVQ